jgi:hypothetical protein
MTIEAGLHVSLAPPAPVVLAVNDLGQVIRSGRTAECNRSVPVQLANRQTRGSMDGY